jgi:hypothetical protein
MVRVPASFARAGMAGLAGSGSRRGVAARRIPSPDVRAYDRLVTVDLGNDGVAPQVTMAGFAAQSGESAVSPGAFASVLTTTVPGGSYLLQWSVSLSGTLSAGDANNMALYVNGSFVAGAVYPAVAGTYPQTAVLISPDGAGNDLKILTSNAGTTGSQYGASIGQNSGIPGTTEAFVGPSAFGESWALDQCFLSTSVGPLDPAQCTVYVGPGVAAQYAVTGSLAGGGSQFGLGGLGLAQGWFVWAVWSGGTPQSFAYLRVTGTKSVLTN